MCDGEGWIVSSLTPEADAIPSSNPAITIFHSIVETSMLLAVQVRSRIVPSTIGISYPVTVTPERGEGDIIFLVKIRR